MPGASQRGASLRRSPPQKSAAHDCVSSAVSAKKLSYKTADASGSSRSMTDRSDRLFASV